MTRTVSPPYTSAPADALGDVLASPSITPQQRALQLRAIVEVLERPDAAVVVGSMSAEERRELGERLDASRRERASVRAPWPSAERVDAAAAVLSRAAARRSDASTSDVTPSRDELSVGSGETRDVEGGHEGDRTRVATFQAQLRARGLVDARGVPDPRHADAIAIEVEAFLASSRTHPRLEASVRNLAIEALYARAAGESGPTRARTLAEADRIARNLPLDPSERATIEALASGRIRPEQLSRNEAARALELMRRYPPRTGGTAAEARPEGVAKVAEESRRQALARARATRALEARVGSLDALYARQGWTRDVDLEPGTPAADQAIILYSADRARAATRAGEPLSPQSYAGLSALDTRKTLTSIAHFVAENPSIFGDPPPTDPAALETRRAITVMRRDLTRHAAIQAAALEVDALEADLDRVLAERGVVGRFADAVKNGAGLDGGSDAVVASVRRVAEARRRLDALRSYSGDDAAFHEVFEAEVRVLSGAVDGVRAQLVAFGVSQAQWVDTIATLGACTAALIVAGTGPLSLGALAVGGFVGSGTKVAMKGLDAATGSAQYEGSVALDLATGFLSGASTVGSAHLAAFVSRALVAGIGTRTASAALATRVGAAVVGDAVGGAVDGGVVAGGSAALEGANRSEISARGIEGAMFGLVLGPLVGGVARGAGALAALVRKGGHLPPRVRFTEAPSIAHAALERAGLGGKVEIRAKPLEPHATPYARVGQDGRVEIGVPIGPDGTVSRAALAHEIEHVRQFAEARRVGDSARLAALEEAEQLGQQVHALEARLAHASTPAEREATEAALAEARAAYAGLPVEREARAAALRAEAEVLEAAGHRGIAARLRTFAEGVRTGRRGADSDVATARAAPSAARARVELLADKTTAEAEALAFLEQEAGRVHAELRALVVDGTYLGVKLEPAEVAKHQRELLEELGTLRVLAESVGADFAKVLGRSRPDATSGDSAGQSSPAIETSTEIKRTFEPAPYHGKADNAVKSRGPTNGQIALDNSVQVKPTSPRRVGVDRQTGEFVVLDRTQKQNETYHGHVRAWAELHPDMQRALIDSGQVDKNGNLNGAKK